MDAQLALKVPPVVDFDTEREVVTFRDFTTTSPEVYKHLVASSDVVEEARAALLVGCVSLARTNAITQTDVIAGKVDDLTSRVSAVIGKTREELSQEHAKLVAAFDPSRTDSITSRLDAKFQERLASLDKVVADTFAPNGTAATTLKAVLSEDGLAYLRNTLTREIHELRDVFTQRLTQLTSPQQASHAIGQAFEERVLDTINSWARSAQRIGGLAVEVQDVRKVVGATGKSADFVVCLTAGTVTKKLGIEAKDQQNLSVNRALGVLAESKLNRGVDLMAMVLTEANMPKEVGSYARFGEDRIIVDVNVLDVVLRLLVSELMLARPEEDGAGVDVKAARTQVQEIQTILRQFDGLMATARATVRSAEKMAAQAEAMRGEACDAADELLTTLRGGKGGSHGSGK